MKRIRLSFASLLVVSVVIVVIFHQTGKVSTRSKVVASNSTFAMTDDSQWSAGSLDNISVSSGSIGIDDKTTSPSQVDTSGSTVTATCSSETKQNAIDNDINTEWGPNPSMGPACYWTIQFPSQVRLKSYHLDLYAYTGLDVYTSMNGTDWTKQNATTIITLSEPAKYSTDRDLTTETDALYFRMKELNSAPYEVGVNIWELKLYSPGTATATHISGDEQITNNDLWQWQTFTPTYTKPANSNVQFRFRTSTDHSTWTEWTAYQTPASGEALDLTSLVTSKTGEAGSETFYKYIQVETQLTSTDGVANPTLSSYSIGYHSNVKPNAPTAQSVIIGR